MNKITVIKFVPYFPPHKWWLESHVQERSQRWVKKWYGNVINVTTPMWQNLTKEHDKIYYKDEIIWYKKDWYTVIILDAFDLIPVFPFPKFWTKKFWIVLSYLKSQIKSNWKEHTIVNTHTRFFITSLVWWLFAKYNWVKRIHIEHGVDFVKLASKLKSFVAYIYDQTIGRYIFRCSTVVIWISAWCQRFAHKFTKKEIPVIHRGMDFSQIIKSAWWKKEHPKSEIIIGFVGRIVKLKWLDLLVQAFNNLQAKYKNLKLEIVWDWDETERLKDMIKSLWLQNKISFLWFKERDFVANNFLPHVDIVVNPSYQEWLPTSVLEWLLSKCVIVATDVGGTPEISDKSDLILVKKWDINSLQKWLEYAINNYKTLTWLSYDYVKSHFDWNSSIQQYHNVYTHILKNEK